MGPACGMAYAYKNFEHHTLIFSFKPSTLENSPDYDLAISNDNSLLRLTLLMLFHKIIHGLSGSNDLLWVGYAH